MDRILIILKKENGPRASSAPALGLNAIIFKYVYWYMEQISGERLQDHWSSCWFFSCTGSHILESYCRCLKIYVYEIKVLRTIWFSDQV